MAVLYQIWMDGGPYGLSTVVSYTTQTLQVDNSMLMTSERWMPIHPLTKSPSPSLDEVRQSVARFRCGKAGAFAASVWELFKARAEVLSHKLHPVLTVVQQSGTILLAGKWSSHTYGIWKGKGNTGPATTTGVLHHSVS